MSSRVEAEAPDAVTCSHCGSTGAGPSFCGACGAHLAHEDTSKAARRLHSYAAFPDEPVPRASVVSSLFPQLASTSRLAFRLAFGVFVVVLLGLALARLGPAVVAVSALAVPLLFLCYLAEVGPAEKGFVVPIGALFLAGAGLGAAFALLLGPTVSAALLPTLSLSMGSAAVLKSALLAPVVGQLLMVVPALVLSFRRPPDSRALDGFTAGATSALGFSLAAVLIELSSGVKAGEVTHGPVLGVLTEAVLRGLSAPLVSAALTGYIGACLWIRHDARSTVAGKWLTSPVVVLGLALLLQVGLGFADDARLSDAVLIVVHLFAIVLALGLLRLGLHHALLHEQRHIRTGENRLCPHCHHDVPAMPFCPTCGVSEAATAHSPPSLQGHWRTGPQATHRLGPRTPLGVVIAGLALAAAIFVALAATVSARAPSPCVSLRCFSPFGPLRIENGTTYRSGEGWGVTWYPAAAVLNTSNLKTAARASPDQLHLTFSSPAAPAEDGDLFFVGIPAHGKGAAQLVNALQESNAPDATPDYVLPGATVGYHLGYGEAFETTPTSAEGDGVTYEIVITCAVENGYGICGYGVGPQVDLDKVVAHPTLSKLALSLWSDPDVNGVFWKGAGLP
jgi:RsiW-degrading membrane proteinase PrsW (M82 family)